MSEEVIEQNGIDDYAYINWSNPLEKAQFDCFQYAVRLTTGEIVVFSEAKASGDGYLLTGIEMNESSLRSPYPTVSPFNPERGLWIARNHIVWALDAPFGS